MLSCRYVGSPFQKLALSWISRRRGCGYISRASWRIRGPDLPIGSQTPWPISPARNGFTPYCALSLARCGAVAVVENGRFTRLEPDPGHPTGQALCAKGRAALELVDHPVRPVSNYASSGHEQHANVTQTARAMSLLYALTGSRAPNRSHRSRGGGGRP
jgi:anaerobic selenocysteine-containing dehydrogenase